MRSIRQSITVYTAVTALIAGIAVSAVAAVLRAASIDAGPAITWLTDFNRLERVAFLEGRSLDEIARHLMAAGVDGFVVRDRTLAELETLGRVDVAWGWELLDELRLRGADPLPALSPLKVYVHSPQPELQRWLHERLRRRWPYGGIEAVTVDGVPWLGIAAPPTIRSELEREPVPRYADDYSGPYPRELMMYPLGIEPEAIERVRSWGAGVAAEIELPEGHAWRDEAWWQGLSVLPQGSFVIFKGGVIAAADPAAVAREIANRGWRVGLVWGRTTDALRAVAEALPGRLVKVHPVWPGEPVASVLNGIEERFERVLYDQRFVTLNPDSEATVAPERIRGIREALQSKGYQRGWAAPLQADPVPSPARWGALLALIGAGGLLVPQRPGWGLLAVSLPLGAAAGLWGERPAFWQAAALAVAILFPVLGVRWTAGWLDDAWHAERHPVIVGLFALTGATALATAGGLVVQTLLGTDMFTLQLLQFRGVKIALAAPVAWLLVAGGVRYRHGLREALLGGLRRPIGFGQLAGLLFAVAVMALVLLRAGNFPLIPVWDVERHLRTWLDAVLIARPRTKEFLFGHPLLFIAGAWAAARCEEAGGTLAQGWRWLLPLAAVGPTSVVNTFAHIHTPLAVSLLRTWNGLWLGALLGFLAWTVLRLVWRPVGPVRLAAAGGGTGKEGS